jgi:hypothetical protein
MRTVDLVLSGEDKALLAVALDAIRSGQRLLVVLCPGDERAARRLRRALVRAASPGTSRVSIVTAAEVVCVDGIDGVEVVLVRHLRTGRVSAVNASAFRSCGEFSESAGAIPIPSRPHLVTE